jgi:erythromycin esterase-like protein
MRDREGVFPAARVVLIERETSRPDIVSVMVLVRIPAVVAFVALSWVCMGAARAPGPSQAANQAPEITDASVIVRELCGKNAALLGESPLHGFGKTLQFKVGLVRQLIDECHYNALLMESGIYDFLNIQKKLKSGQDVTESMIAAAIGGLWATREVQPLIPFLREKVRTGNLTIGGLDDQLGRGTYAQHEMSSDLVEYLPGEEKAQCLAILQKHTLWQYSADAPYSPNDKALILGCLEGIETRLSQVQARVAPWREYDRAMIESLKRSLARDFRQDLPKGADERILDENDRNRSMHLNFRWLLSRLPSHSKVIVWAATTHLAKDLSGVGGVEGIVPLGSYIRRDFKERAFALGFSAYSGSYAMAGQPVRQLSVAPDTSLEGKAFAARDSDIIYLSLKELRKFGSIAARPLGSSFKTARWNEVLDGLLIFREEQPPEFRRR